MSTTADDTPKYFWDSFDLNHDNAEAGNAAAGHSEVPAAALANSNADNASFVSTADSSSKPAPLDPVAAQVDPTRDIETLPEDVRIATMPRKALGQDNVSNADTEDEPQLGQVFPNKKPVSTR